MLKGMNITLPRRINHNEKLDKYKYKKLTSKGLNQFMDIEVG